jgi:hypothetical protein
MERMASLLEERQPPSEKVNAGFCKEFERVSRIYKEKISRPDKRAEAKAGARKAA